MHTRYYFSVRQIRYIIHSYHTILCCTEDRAEYCFRLKRLDTFSDIRFELSYPAVGTRRTIQCTSVHNKYTRQCTTNIL